MIKSAAIKLNGIIYSGKRHPEIIAANKFVNLNKGEEGFLTKDGLFVDRFDAAKIAYQSRQIKRPKKRIISEDLW